MQIPPFLCSPPQPISVSKSNRNWFVIPVSLISGGLLAFFAIRAIMTPKVVADIKALTAFQECIAFLSFFVVAWLSILIHESGHLFGGILSGMKPTLLVAGPLKVAFKGLRPIFSFNQVLSTWGGLAVAVPADGKTTRAGLTLMVAGGPSFSLLAGSGGFACAFGLAGAPGLIVSLFSLISLAIGFGTLLPIHSGGFLSDGAQLLQIWKGSRDVAAKILIGIVLGEDLSGVRPRDWSTAPVLAELENVSDPMIRVAAHSILAASASDSGNNDAAVLAFEQFAKTLHEGGLDSYPGPFRGELVLPVAIFIAQNYQDSVLANKWMQLGDKALLEPHLLTYAKAELAKASGDMDSAKKYAADALAIISKYPPSGSACHHREKLEKLSNGC